jgi:uncharacterized OsmC-like protein
MICNGIDTGQLATLAETLVTHPDEARVSAQVRTGWEDRYRLRVRSEELTLGAQRFPRGTALTVDLPPALGGTDVGPTPGELVLMALGACVTQSFIETAAATGVRIDGLDVTIEGSLDLRGTAGVEGVRPGMSHIHLAAEVESADDEDVLQSLLTVALQRSPVADSLRAGVTIDGGLLAHGHS